MAARLARAPAPYARFDAIRVGDRVKLFAEDPADDSAVAVWPEVLGVGGRLLRVRFEADDARAFGFARQRTVTAAQVWEHTGPGGPERFWRAVGLAGAAGVALWWWTRKG